MRKYLSVVLLLSGALYGSTEVRLSADLEKKWLDYKAQKYALTADEFETMAQLAEDDDLEDQLEKVAEELDEVADEMEDIEVPDEGLVISLERKDQWDALKKEGQALRERKAAEIEYQAKEAAQEPEAIEEVDEE